MTMATSEHSYTPRILQWRREREILRLTQIVAAYYSLNVGDVCDHQQLAPRLITARQVVSYLAHEVARRSYPEIGRALKYSAHTTPLYNKRRIERRLKIDPGLASQIGDLTSYIQRDLRRGV